ncbi:hypothetical protein [Plantactinospora sp. CA-290183]|uniref:hypothetical protein n=1 Tax=Plantactinospora sp. CA-290183 TaxID=3240006 RepID=UPI003D925353
MSTPTIPTLPGCGRGASARVEVYSPKGGRANGSLIAVAYACSEHLDDIEQTMTAAGSCRQGVTDNLDVRPVCGGLLWFDAPTSTAVTAVQGLSTAETPKGTHSAGTPSAAKLPGAGDLHPAWCAALTTAEGTCAERGWHGTGYIAAAGPDDMTLVEAEAFGQFDDMTGRWVTEIMLRLTEQDVTTTYVLSLDQGLTVATLLADLVARVRGGGQ